MTSSKIESASVNGTNMNPSEDCADGLRQENK